MLACLLSRRRDHAVRVCLQVKPHHQIGPVGLDPIDRQAGCAGAGFGERADPAVRVVNAHERPHLHAAKVEGIYVPCYYTEAALICKQARDLGIEVPLFGIDGWESTEFLSIGGKAVEGGYFSTHYSAESKDPGVVAFNDRFRKHWGIPSDAISALGYDSVMLLVDAIKRAGTTESAKLRAALAATKNFRGVTGIITLDAQRNAMKSAVVLTVKDGKFQFVETVNP